MKAQQDGLYVLMTEAGAGELKVSSPGEVLMAPASPFASATWASASTSTCREGCARCALLPPPPV